MLPFATARSLTGRGDSRRVLAGKSPNVLQRTEDKGRKADNGHGRMRQRMFESD